MSTDPFDKYARLYPLPPLPEQRSALADEVPLFEPAPRRPAAPDYVGVYDFGCCDTRPLRKAFAPDDTPASPPRVWPGGVRTLGPLLLIPGRSVHVEDLAEAEQLHRAIGEAIAHLHTEFGTDR